MEHRTVGGGTACNPETTYYALEALALGDADDVHKLAFLENFDGDYIAGLGCGSGREAHFGQTADGCNTGLLKMTELRLAETALFLGAETELDGIIAIASHGLDLDYRAGTGFDYGDGDEGVVAIIHLRHPYFLT
jgi:hypothetical protein